MRIAIVGNREGWTYEEVKTKLLTHAINSTDTIISGGAKGVDSFAETFAKEINAKIELFLPDYRQPSPERYFKRNRLIVDSCDKLIAFDKSKEHSGTKYTINYCQTQGKHLILHNS